MLFLPPFARSGPAGQAVGRGVVALRRRMARGRHHLRHVLRHVPRTIGSLMSSPNPRRRAQERLAFAMFPVGLTIRVRAR